MSIEPSNTNRTGADVRAESVRNLIHLSKRWEYLFNAGLKGSGLTVQQFYFLAALEKEFDAPPNLAETAAALRMSYQNVRQIAEALERGGWLSIAGDESDRRVRRLVLTGRHHRFWKERGAGDEQFLEELFEPLSGEQRALLLDMLSGLLAKANGLYDLRT